MSHSYAMLRCLLLLLLLHSIYPLTEQLTIDRQLQSLTIPDPSFERLLYAHTHQFCATQHIQNTDCQALLQRLLQRWVEFKLLSCPDHLSIVPLDPNVHTLRILTQTTIVGSQSLDPIHFDPINHHYSNHRVRVRTTTTIGTGTNAKEIGQWSVATPSQNGQTSFDILARTSHGPIGCTVLELQAGMVLHVGNDKEKHTFWMASATKRMIFDIIPSSLPLPSHGSQMMVASTPLSPTILQTIRISYVTSFGNIPNGQSEILVQTAIGLMKKNTPTIAVYDIQFLTTTPVNTTHPLVRRLHAAKIPVIHTPIQVDRSLYEEHRRKTIPIVRALLERIDRHAKVHARPAVPFVPAAPLLLEDSRYNKMIFSLAMHLQSTHIVQFTNVEQYKENDAIIAGAAKLVRVPHVLCDPGNLNFASPTLYAVTGLVVPSNVAQLHWSAILHPPAINSSNNTSTTADTPNMPMIHVVQPGAATATMATKTRNSNRTVVAYLGRLDRIKSPSMFIRLVASLMQEEHQWQVPYEFWVIGAGNLKATLQEMLHALMMLPSKNRSANNPTLSASTFSSIDDSIDRFVSNRITFMGSMSHAKVLSLLKHDIDIVVHSTLSNETFGLSNVEAMALGVPVISTCVGGVADYLRHNMSHGTCVPSTTSTSALIDEMKHEVYRLASLTNVDWNKTSRAAIEYVQSHGLRKRDMIHRYHVLYSGLIRKAK